MRFRIILSTFLIFLTLSILMGQTNGGPDTTKDNKNWKNFGVTIGIEAFGTKNKAGLIGYNLKINYSNHSKIFWSAFFKKGYDFTGFGAVEPNPNREKLVKYLNEGGFLFSYRIAETQTGPYLQMGISYLNGKKNNGITIKTVGIPIEGGVNFKIISWFAFKFGITSNFNKAVSYHGFNFSLNFGNK